MTQFELQLIEFLREFLKPIDKVFEIITSLGEQQVLIVILVFVYFLFSKKAGQRIAFAIFSGLLINNALKGLIRRVRPFNNPNSSYDLPSDNVLEHATGYSFPSGHAQNAGVSYTSFGLNLKNKKAWFIFGGLILLVAFSRSVLGVHYPTDAIIGAALGIGIAFAADYLHRKFEQNFGKQMFMYIVVAIFFFPFLLIFWRFDYNDILIYKDFYTGYAFFLGYIIAVFLERKYVDFDCYNTLKVRIIRSIIALLLVFILQFGLDAIFPDNYIFFDMARYFLLSFIGLGIYPLLTRKWLFCKAN